MMNSFDQTIEHMAIDVEQDEGTCILFGVSDDTVLLQHAVDVLRKRLSPEITIRDFRYDPEHLSLLEGAIEAAALHEGRPAVSVTGFEALTRDKRTEAIQLLNLQRNRFGRTGIAVILWVNRATLAEISNWSADFYSWRSATFLLEPPPGWNTLESMRRSYLQALVAQNEFVNLQGLAPMRGGQIVQMRMEDIFIPLRAEQEVTSFDTQPFLGPRASAMAGTSIIEEAEEVQQPASMLTEMQRIQKRWAFEAMHEVKTRPVEIPKLLQERRAIVLGDPGAGKTTLLRYIAYTLARSQIAIGESEILKRIPDLADCLPVYVRIGEYAQHLQQKPEATLDVFAPIGCQARQFPLTDELVNDAMAQGRVLFLLDGLDEVIDTGQRQEVARCIEEFAFSHPQCRMLMTSRVVGYREVRLGGEFSQLTISPFEDNEICCFAQSWYKALGRHESAEELVKVIQGNPSIRRLASNPLLLTVIALIHWRGTRLPHYRITLYRLAAETLVNQWMSYRRVSPEGWDVHETLQVLLPTIAWHLHQTTSTGLISKHKLHSLLVETLQRHDLSLSENEAHTRASQFRRNVSEFSGIFLERGLDQYDRGIYGFLHLTFEEYFAARLLADKWEREGNSVLKPLLHDPRWIEIILLIAGHFAEFSPYRATQFVRMILEAQSEYEEILHRDLLISAHCLADDVRVDADLRREILFKLLKVYFDSKSPRALREDIRKVFTRLGGTIVGKDVLQGLSQRLTDHNGGVRVSATLALGDLGHAVVAPDALAALLKLLTDPERYVRMALAVALGKIGQGVATPNVQSALLKLLIDSDGGVRLGAAEGVRQMGQAAATPDVLAALLRLLADPVRDVQFRAAGALGEMGSAAATPDVQSALLSLLTHFNGNVRLAAAVALARMGQAASALDIPSALLSLLTNPNWEVRQAGTIALGEMGQAAATPEGLAALLKLLADPVRDVREAAAEAVGQMGQAATTPDALAALLKLLTDSDRYVRKALALALGKIGQTTTAEVLAALLKLLIDSDGGVRLGAAEAVRQMGQAAATPEGLAALLKRLADRDRDVRAAAAEAVGQMGEAAATPEVLSRLHTLLTEPERDVCRAAAEAMGTLSAYIPPQHRSQAVELFLPLTRSSTAVSRNTGYVGLRNLLAVGPL